jgi:uncharacterized protein
MSDSPSRFVWYELLTTDADAAKAYYADVAGWTTQDAPMPGMTYTLLSAGAAQVGGLMATPQELLDLGIPPCWTGYVGVDDVDASAEKAKSLGGEVRRPPDDIPGVGRFAIVADPLGAVIALFHADQPAPEWAPAGTAGHFGWHELYTDDIEKAFAFYAALFGWRKDEALDMGPMGTYQLFAIGERVCGGVMTKRDLRRRQDHERPHGGARRRLDHPGAGSAGRMVRLGREALTRGVRGRRSAVAEPPARPGPGRADARPRPASRARDRSRSPGCGRS